MIKLFIIEDNLLYSAALKQYLLIGFEKSDYNVEIMTFKNSESCLEWLNCYNSTRPDIIIMDYFLNSQHNYSMNGVDALFNLKIFKLEIEVIFLSGQPKIEIAVEALRMGAFDYIVKNELAFQKVMDSVQDCLREMNYTGTIIPKQQLKNIAF